MAPDVTAPLRLEFDVPCSPDRAFDLWTSRIDLWWPPAHCAPPARLIYRWHLCSDPADATEVEVQFLASAPGTTRVRLDSEFRYDREPIGTLQGPGSPE
jgi:hypothetical protein